MTFSAALRVGVCTLLCGFMAEAASAGSAASPFEARRRFLENAPATPAQIQQQAFFDARVTPPSPDVKSVREIRSLEAFERIAARALVSSPTSAAPYSHAVVLVDRQNANRVHYVDTRRFASHEEFLRASRLVERLDTALLHKSLSDHDRRFVFATLAFDPSLKRWTFELAERDRITPELLKLLQARLTATFFAQLVLRATSQQHEEAARAAGVSVITLRQINEAWGNPEVVVLNPGTVVGRLRLVSDLENALIDDVEPFDIVVLDRAPLALTKKVSGIVVVQSTSPVATWVGQARQWSIPGLSAVGAWDALRQYEKRWVRLVAADAQYSVTSATQSEIEAQASAFWPVPAIARASKMTRYSKMVTPNLTQRSLVPLEALRSGSASTCGGRSARLGTIERARVNALNAVGTSPATDLAQLADLAPTPDGFCVPFALHARWTDLPEVQARVKKAMNTARFDRFEATRRRALSELAVDLRQVPIPVDVEREIVSRWRSQLGGMPVLVRPSSNWEDLRSWSGSGPFETAPAAALSPYAVLATTEAQLLAAVHQVWASTYSLGSVDARREVGIRHDAERMAVFLQRAVIPQSSGVAVTQDPFDPTRPSTVFVAALRGDALRVVQDRRIAEQSLYDAKSGAIQRFPRSSDFTALDLQEDGGLREVPLNDDRQVISDYDITRVATAALSLKTLFAGAEQDIEWAIDAQGRILILQAKPFVAGARAPLDR